MLTLKSIVIEEELETLESWNLKSIAFDLKNEGFVDDFRESNALIELEEIDLRDESL